MKDLTRAPTFTSDPPRKSAGDPAYDPPYLPPYLPAHHAADAPAGDPGGCPLAIRIEARGDVNIHHHCAPAPAPSCELPPVACYPPPAEGNTCLPPVAGAKHKRSPAQKLQSRTARTTVPSVLAASTMHLVRRFLLGKPPANPLEAKVFARLTGVSALTRSTLACAVERFDALPAGQRIALLTPALALDADQPIDPGVLSAAFGREIAQRAGGLAFGATEERPGRIRIFEPGVEDFSVQVRICSVNQLRTDDFIPRLAPGDYGPAEIAQDCITRLVDGQPQVVCQVRTANCVGGAVDGVCLRVPAIAAGDGVVLQGVNFFSIDARVILTARAPGTTVRELDAFVVGDLDTALTETVGGVARLITDCRVHDRIGFTVPADLPPASYDVQVALPNITGFAQFGDRLFSNAELIEVTPPVTARFQITAEKLHCSKETSPAFLGSDEVGLRVIAVPLLADLSIGTPQLMNKRFSDVDSEEDRNIGQLLFDQRQTIVAVALAVLGHEVDGEDAYQNQVTSTTDIFVDLVKEQVASVKGALKAAGIGASEIAGLGSTGLIAAAIAIGVLLAIDFIVALWAPADLIIEDPTGYTLLDLVERTGASFPPPPESSFRTEGDIDVKVAPQDKLPQQYRERRTYESDAEDSRYQLFFRFNRVA